MTPAIALAAALAERPFDELVEEAVAFHGHLCPGQVLGVRMAVAGCREVGIPLPRQAGKGLVVFVEIDRCATDAIQALTGVSLDKRTLKHLDYGKMAATFVNIPGGAAVRVSARGGSRALAASYAPGQSDVRQAQIQAYRVMPEAALLSIEPVVVNPGWLDRRRVRVFCEECGEGINYQREITAGGRILCRPCNRRTILRRALRSGCTRPPYRRSTPHFPLDSVPRGRAYRGAMPHPSLLIGEVARRSGVTRKALRLYEAAGILPSPTRTAAGYRVYGKETLAVLRFVLQARRLGLTLDEIKDIVAIKRSGQQPCTHVRGLVGRKAADVDRTVRDLTAVRSALRSLLAAWSRHQGRVAAVCPHIEHAEKRR